MTLVARGVWERSYLSPAGLPIYVAVNQQHCEVASLALQADHDPDAIVRTLWALLDASDPEHARRATARDPEPITFAKPA